MVKLQESKCNTQVENSQKSTGNLDISTSKSKITSITDSNTSSGTEPSRLTDKSRSRSRSHSRTRISSRVRFSDTTEEFPNPSLKGSKETVHLDTDLMDQSSSKCLDNDAVLPAERNKSSEKTSTLPLLDTYGDDNVLEPFSSESGSIKKSRTFIFIKKNDENEPLSENETKNALIADIILENQPEEQEDHIIATSELLDPEVPIDGLSSSKSTPGNLSNVSDELAEAHITNQPSLRKILSTKRSTSASHRTENETMVTPDYVKSVRRKLSERRGLFDMVADGEVMRDALLSATLPRRRCRLFPFGLDLREAAKKVSASRSVDGEWSISDHPNHKVLPTGPLYAQESAFPAFYDKIEIPVPLPPWDDPGFSLESDVPPPELQPQQRPAQSMPALQSHSKGTTEETSNAPSQGGAESHEENEN